MPADEVARAQRFAARAALIGIALVFAVIVASAYLRLSGAAPGWSGVAGAARIVHRVAASLEAVLVVMLVAVCWQARHRWAGGMRAAAAIAALSLGLAFLGIATTEHAPPAVQLGNLLGGMALFGAFGWLAHEARSSAPPDRTGVARWVSTGVALFAVQIALGGLVSTQQAAASCPALPLCDSGWRPADENAAHSRAAPQAATPYLAEPARRALHMAHRILALGLLAYWIALVLGLRRRAPTSAARAAPVAALLLVQAGLGAAVVASGAATLVALAHNACAALAVLAAVRALRRSSAPGLSARALS
jgi:cytochrome c oxidase assembly protein subunit 15